MASDQEHDWQITKKNINERTAHLLKSEHWSDCSFIVGSEPNQRTFHVHKMILAMSSPVFEAMFYGGIAEQQQPVPILDVQPEAFQVLLEYIYTDVVNIISFDQACEVCYAAKKYMLPHLVEQCTQLVFQDLSASNACKAYEFGKLFEEPRLMEKSYNIIREQTEAALDDPSFEEVELSTLLMILDSEVLNISSERDLFNAVHRWAQKECARKGIIDDIAGKRSVIGHALKKIHFLTLTPKQFAEGPGLVGFLTRDESYAILMNISNPGSNVPMPEGFSLVVEPRARFLQPEPLSLIDNDNAFDDRRFYCLRRVGAEFAYNNTEQMDCTLSFTVDRNICILGIQLPSQVTSTVLTADQSAPNGFRIGARPASYNELLYAHLLDSDSSRLTYTHYTSRVDYNQMLEINFNRSVFIQKNKKYKIVVVANKAGAYLLGTEWHQTAVCPGTTFTFINNESPEMNLLYKSSLIRGIIYSH